MNDLIADICLDASAPTALYIQLARHLEAHLAQGRWLPDAALPPERHIAERLGVSRDTVRNAVDVLVRRKALERRVGSGTYVRARGSASSNEARLAEDLVERAGVVEFQWIEGAVAIADASELLSLGLSTKTPVVRVRRLQLVEGEAAAVETTSVPAFYMDDPRQLSGPVYACLKAKYLVPVRAMRYIRAINASAEQSELLGIAPGTALMRITRVSFLANNMPVEMTVSICRNEFFGFVAEYHR